MMLPKNGVGKLSVSSEELWSEMSESRVLAP